MVHGDHEGGMESSFEFLGVVSGDLKSCLGRHIWDSEVLHPQSLKPSKLPRP